MPQPIQTLRPGQRFVLAALPDRRGELLRLGEGSAVVRYEGVSHREVRDRVTGETLAAFDAPEHPVTISLNTAVVPAEGGPDGHH